MNQKTITDALTAVAALQPDIALALGAYSILKNIWMTTNPGKTEADYQTYLQTASQRDIDDTSVYLVAQGYVETPAGSGNWAKPAVQA